MRAARAAAVLGLVAAASCASGMQLRLLDGERFVLDGEEIGWSELRARVSAIVAEANAAGAKAPAITVTSDDKHAQKLFARVVDVLTAAGIRHIHTR